MPEEKAERRQAPRYPLFVAAAVIEAQSGKKLGATVSDISLMGYYLNTPQPLRLGSKVKVQLERSDEIFEGVAYVVHAVPDKGMGVVFADMEPSHRETLQNWIAEMEEAKA